VRIERVRGGFLGVGGAHHAGVRSDARGASAAAGVDYTGRGEAALLDAASVMGGEGAASDPFATMDADAALARVQDDGSLYLARDFFGVAPLYFAHDGHGAVVFASEYKALLAWPRVRCVPDMDMVQHLQHAKRLPLGRTLFSGVQSVLPGAVMRVDGGRGDIVRRAAGLNVDVCVRDGREACELIEREFERAVRVRTGGCDPIGIALSGGIDSIAFAFMVRRVHPGARIVTVTAGADAGDPEIVSARRVAEGIGSEHHEVFTPPTMIAACAPDLVRALEDPFSRSESLQLWAVGREAARRGVRTLFSAQGADGLFAGMPKYKLLWLMRLLPMFTRGLHEFLGLTQLGIPPRGVVGRVLAHLKYKGRLMPPARVMGAAGVTALPALPPRGPEFINRALAAGLQTGVCQDIQKFERGFAAHGVEYRSAFYDRRLVDAMYVISDRLKLVRGEEKWIWRRAAARWVPAEFCTLPKLPQRMRYDASFADAIDHWADEVLGAEWRTTGRTPRAWFEAESVRRLHRPGGPSRGYGDEAAMRIWTLVMTELWARAFIDGRGAAPASPDELRTERAATMLRSASYADGVTDA
jgi:asparagine synthase (glutamine-hydrolysing)